MSLLGKILALLNVIAAVAFVYVASMDYEKREAWALALFRHDLAVTGLPVAEEANPQLHADLGEKDQRVLQGTFEALGEPVKTQLEEVHRIREQVGKEVLSKEDADKQKQQVVDYLKALARSSEERDLIEARVFGPPSFTDLLSPTGPFAGVLTDPQVREKLDSAVRREKTDKEQRETFKKTLLGLSLPNAPSTEEIDQKLQAKPSVEELLSDTGLLGREFRDVLKDVNDRGQVRDPDERHKAIAHLLYTLGQARAVVEPNAAKRAQTVLGLPAYVKASFAQSAVLRDLAETVRDGIAADRGVFETAHQAKVREIIERANYYAKLLAALADVSADETKWTAEVKKRQTVAVDLRAQITQTSAALDAALKAQSARELELFDVQKYLATAISTNLTLERTLRKLEAGR